MSKAKIVREKDFYKMLFSIALPITLQNLVIFFTQMIDTVMLGELGDVSMTSSSLANQPFFIFNMITFGLAGGAAVLTAQYWGKKEIKPIVVIITMIIRFAMFIGLILTIVVLIIPKQIMSIFTNDINVIKEGADYLRIICFSYVFFGFSATFYLVIRSVEIVKIAVFSNIVALVTNASLNYILIFGHFGFPALGIKGAAIATLIARLIEFLMGVIYMFYIDKKLRIKVKDFFRIDKLLIGDLLKISSPVVANELMWALGMSMQASLLGKLGTEAVTANSIVSVVQQLSTVAVFGVASAAAVTIGKAIGEGDMQKARDRGHTFKIISILFGVCVTIVILLLRNVAIDFYNVSPAAKELAHQMIYVAAAIGFFVSIAGISIVGILRGGGDTKYSLWIEGLTLWGIAVPCAYFSAYVLKLPIPLVYLIMKIDEPAKDLLCLIRMKGTRWLKNVTRDDILVD